MFTNLTANAQKLLFCRECLIEATEIICRDNGPVIKKTYPEV